jgi:hypothetical protein
VLVCCWSSKGGVGTTVVATGLALVLARASAPGALLVDVRGDVPTVLGLAARHDTARGDDGLARWMMASGSPEVPVGGGLSIVERGAGALDPAGADALVAALAADARPVVVDAGVLPGTGAAASADDEVALACARGASRSLLVVRPCFLALRRALAAPVRASGVVVVAEDGRALGSADVADALGLPVLAEVQVSAHVARAVDAGVFATRLPRSFEREVRRAA